MTVHAMPMPRRRGACPGLSAPMPTGDGLLVRLLPLGTIPLGAFADLCAAARTHGNGVIEITSRGSIQIRGLTAATAAQFAAAIAALGIAAQDGVPIHCNPLAGIDAAELLDAGALAADLRRALTQRSIAANLSPKVAVAIDGGGALDLAGLAADIRLGAQVTEGGVRLRIGVAGDDTSAADLGVIEPAQGVEAVLRLLDVVAKRGRDARARDVLAAEGTAAFHAAIAELLVDDAPPPPPARIGREAIGLHRLRDGLVACGIGLGFGHADAAVLGRLIDAAAAAGASGLRAAPGRVLITIGLKPEAASGFVVAAAQLGFIVRGNDPRRHVVACAGAPICASAHIAARALAPGIAASAAPYLNGAFTIHISGCAKGCAHAAAAALTVVGTSNGCALIAGGTATDAPFAAVAASELSAAVMKYAREQKHEATHV